jgi:hypothetical protein
MTGLDSMAKLLAHPATGRGLLLMRPAAEWSAQQLSLSEQ